AADKEQQRRGLVAKNRPKRDIERCARVQELHDGVPEILSTGAGSDRPGCCCCMPQHCGRENLLRTYPWSGGVRWFPSLRRLVIPGRLSTVNKNYANSPFFLYFVKKPGLFYA